ncbi:MAG: N-methyl-L-tryptophan oxidase, partial [Bauldia sp.]
MTGAEANRRFPGYRLPDDHRVLLQPDGGFVLSERAIVAHVTMAQALGADIRARETVLDWSPIAGGGVRVRTTRGSYEAGRLVLAPGAWIGDLVPALKPIAVPERQVLGWFQPGDPAKFAPDAFPVLNLMVEEGRYYLLPIWGVPGLKIGLYHHLGETGAADAISRDVTREDEAVLRRCIGRYFPQADGPTMALHACMFTNTPDEHFIIDTLPGNADVVVASPCSGHGYKFASVVGDIVADLATTGTSRFDLSMFRMDRF